MQTVKLLHCAFSNLHFLNKDFFCCFSHRLQYFARGVQSSMKQLRLALKGKAGAQLKTEENKIKVVALRITSNINTLIKVNLQTVHRFKGYLNIERCMINL